MSKGFDADTQLTQATAARFVAAGYVAAGRYLKNLTMTEVAACAQAGLKLWLIDEGYGDAVVFARGTAGGLADGGKAKDRADALDAPPGSVIFFAIDYDAGQGDVANIKAYYGGYAAACAPYRAGMYADGLIASQVPTPVGDYLPGASGWAGTKDYIASGKVALLQHPPATVLGLDVDPVDILDESVLWDPATNVVPTPAPAPTPEPAPPDDTDPMPDLKVAQAYLGVTADGVYGPITAAAFEDYYTDDQ